MRNPSVAMQVLSLVPQQLLHVADQRPSFFFKEKPERCMCLPSREGKNGDTGSIVFILCSACSVKGHDLPYTGHPSVTLSHTVHNNTFTLMN